MHCAKSEEFSNFSLNTHQLRFKILWLLKLLEIPQIRHFGQCWEINALFDIIDLPTDLFGFAAYSFNCGGLK